MLSNVDMPVSYAAIAKERVIPNGISGSRLNSGALPWTLKDTKGFSSVAKEANSRFKKPCAPNRPPHTASAERRTAIPELSNRNAGAHALSARLVPRSQTRGSLDG